MTLKRALEITHQSLEPLRIESIQQLEARRDRRIKAAQGVMADSAQRLERLWREISQIEDALRQSRRNRSVTYYGQVQTQA